jgi:hypothetical protein
LQAQQARDREHHERAEQPTHGPVAGAGEDAPALIDATAAQNATMRSFVAVRTPRSAGAVTSAITDVPATKHPDQPSPSRKKNGVISGVAPTTARPSAPVAQTPMPARLVRRRPRRSASSPTG